MCSEQCVHGSTTKEPNRATNREKKYMPTVGLWCSSFLVIGLKSRAGCCTDWRFYHCNTHTQSINEKTRSAVHGLLTLKRHGVQPKSLGKFYQARIVPILTYAAPAWYCYIPQYCKDQLERHQSLCLRLIFPTISSYTERLETSKVPRLNNVLENLCTNYVAKAVSDSSHRLYHHVPPKQSIHRHSARLSDKPILKSRTALLSKSLFHAFAWIFLITPDQTIINNLLFVLICSQFSWHY